MIEAHQSSSNNREVCSLSHQDFLNALDTQNLPVSAASQTRLQRFEFKPAVARSQASHHKEFPLLAQFTAEHEKGGVVKTWQGKDGETEEKLFPYFSSNQIDHFTVYFEENTATQKPYFADEDRSPRSNAEMGTFIIQNDENHEHGERFILYPNPTASHTELSKGKGINYGGHMNTNLEGRMNNLATDMLLNTGHYRLPGKYMTDAFRQDETNKYLSMDEINAFIQHNKQIAEEFSAYTKQKFYRFSDKDVGEIGDNSTIGLGERLSLEE